MGEVPQPTPGASQRAERRPGTRAGPSSLRVPDRPRRRVRGTLRQIGEHPHGGLVGSLGEVGGGGADGARATDLVGELREGLVLASLDPQIPGPGREDVEGGEHE